MLKYSIIVPCYNVEKYLPYFLENIPTNRNDFEIIFVDDKSIDNTVKLVENFCRKNKNFRIVKLKKNIGAGLAILQGIKRMKTNWFAHLDPDDIVFKEYFDEIPKYTNDNNSLIRFKFKKFENNKIKMPNLMWRLYFKSSWGWTCLINFNEVNMPNWTRRMYYDDLFLFATSYRKNDKKHIFINKYLAAYRVNRPNSMTTKQSISKQSINDLKIAYKFYKNNRDIKLTPRKVFQEITIWFDIKNRTAMYKKQQKLLKKKSNK